MKSHITIHDIQRERHNEIGRNFTHPPLNLGECFINEKSKPKDYDPLKASKFVFLKFSPHELLNQITSDYNRMNPDARPLFNNFTELDVVVMPCKVIYVDDSPKVGQKYPHHVTIEYSQALKLLSYYLPYAGDKDEELKRYLR